LKAREALNKRRKYNDELEKHDFREHSEGELLRRL
jgi:hypothetical protein